MTSLQFSDNRQRGLPITAAAQALTVIVRLKAKIVGSNPTQGIDICVPLVCVCVTG
jgi:hypothetical protein